MEAGYLCITMTGHIYAHLLSAKEMLHALLIFHALSGCDTVSGFVRDGKNQNCMSVQNLLLVLTDALLTLRSQNKACIPLRGCTHVYMSTCMQ